MLGLMLMLFLLSDQVSKLPRMLHLRVLRESSMSLSVPKEIWSSEGSVSTRKDLCRQLTVDPR